MRALALVICLTACVPQPAPTASAPVTKTPSFGSLSEANQAIAKFTQADLTNAIVIAKNAGPQGMEIASCFTFLQTQLTALQDTPRPGIVGAATAFTVTDLALGDALAAGSGSAQTAFEMACGPLAIHVLNQGISLTTQIAQLLAVISPK